LTGTVSGLDSLIFTVDAEAFAKGVEEERERIRKAGVPVSNVTFSPNGKVMQLESDGGDHMPSYFVPASALAPKESEK
jgi:L-asparaginase/Glu-tRNA(Gln) amidotransferase subunit D